MIKKGIVNGDIDGDKSKAEYKALWQQLSNFALLLKKGNLYEEKAFLSTTLSLFAFFDSFPGELHYACF